MPKHFLHALFLLKIVFIYCAISLQRWYGDFSHTSDPTASISNVVVVEQLSPEDMSKSHLLVLWTYRYFRNKDFADIIKILG